MRQTTKVERVFKKPMAAAAPLAELDDAVTWLSEHFGFPAPSRKQYESRAPRSRRA